MVNRKNIFLVLVLLVSIVATGMYDRRGGKDPIRIEGHTMGTTYHITYFDRHHRNFKTSIDSLLEKVNKSISTYDTGSEVSHFNRRPEGLVDASRYFVQPVKKAKEIFTASQGAFDPTVMPLVNAWGFGPGKSFKPTQHQIDSILTFVGFEKIIFSGNDLRKLHPNVQLDFGGIGQGYGADVITEFLKAKGIVNMLVELGGEGMAVGKNIATGKPWQIGIIDPNSTPENQFFKAYVPLANQSFTTSANYFNYYEADGVKYSHTIDPETGYPARRAILSASVFAADCATADAWATAFMVMGHEKAIELLKSQTDLEAFLIFQSPEGEMKTFTTPGLAGRLKTETNPQQP